MPYFILIVSLIQPVVGLLPAILYALKRNSGSIAIFCISLAFATIAYTSIPPEGYDLTRHYAHIIRLRSYSLNEVISSSLPGYRLFDIYAWAINSLNLPKEFLPASIVFISYYLILSIFNKVKLKYFHTVSSKYILLVFLSFWLSIGYVGLVSGIRNPFANIIVFYLTYDLFFENKLKKFVIGSIIAFYIHPFAIAPIILTLFVYFAASYISKPKALIIIGIFLTVATKVVSIIIDYIANILNNFSFYSSAYFDESSTAGAAFIETRTLYGILFNVLIPRLPIYIAQIYLLTIHSNHKDKLYLLLSVMSLYLGLFASYRTLYSRMAAYFLFVFSLYIAVRIAYSKTKTNQRFLILYSISLIIYSLSHVILLFNRFILSSFPEALIKPLMFIGVGL